MDVYQHFNLIHMDPIFLEKSFYLLFIKMHLSRNQFLRNVTMDWPFNGFPRCPLHLRGFCWVQLDWSSNCIAVSCVIGYTFIERCDTAVWSWNGPYLDGCTGLILQYLSNRKLEERVLWHSGPGYSWPSLSQTFWRTAQCWAVLALQRVLLSQAGVVIWRWVISVVVQLHCSVGARSLHVG